MDLAQTLIRSVLRAFYDTRHVLVIDALILHSLIRDDDFAYLMNMHIKDLQKLCGKLKGDRFLTTHTRLETKEGMQRPVHRTYYYIDYRQAIDAIKWRVYTIDKDVKGSAAPVTEKKEYLCPLCDARWTQMEVLDNIGLEGFLCHRCNSPLKYEADGNATGHKQSTRLNNQLRFITDLLPLIDNVHIPENTFDLAYSNRRPVARDAAHRGLDTVPFESAPNRPTAVKGFNNAGPISMSVNISTSAGLSEAERVAEQARKEKMAHQNALPSWMLTSTVTGEAITIANANTASAAAANSTAVVSGMPTGSISLAGGRQRSGKIKGVADEEADAQLNDYFARLKQQAAIKATNSPDSGSEEDEADGVDDVDFEDVGTFSQKTGSQPAAPIPTVVIEKPVKKVQLALEPVIAEPESEDEVEFEDV